MTAQPANDRPNADTASKPLPAGTPAPDFTLPSGPDSRVRLSDLRGKPVILVFYPADWSPVCGDELALFNEILPEFQRHDAQLLGLSVDGVWCHRAYQEARHLNFPLLADFEATALRTHAFAPRVREHFLSGVRSGVNGTPSFFINGVRHDGGWDERSLFTAVQNAALVASRR